MHLLLTGNWRGSRMRRPPVKVYWHLLRAGEGDGLPPQLYLGATESGIEIKSMDAPERPGGEGFERGIDRAIPSLGAAKTPERLSGRGRPRNATLAGGAQGTRSDRIKKTLRKKSGAADDGQIPAFPGKRARPGSGDDLLLCGACSGVSFATLWGRPGAPGPVEAGRCGCVCP